MTPALFALLATSPPLAGEMALGTMFAATNGGGGGGGGPDLTWFLNFGTLGVVFVLLITGVLPTPGELKTLRKSEERAWAALVKEQTERDAERKVLQQRIDEARAEVTKVRDTMVSEVVPALTRNIDTNRSILGLLAGGQRQ